MVNLLKVYETFDLDRKHGKPSKHTILAKVVNQFLKTWSVLMGVPCSVIQKTKKNWEIMPNTNTIGRHEILKKVQGGLSLDFR